MAQSGRSKLKQPNALFEFVIKEGEVSTVYEHVSHDWGLNVWTCVRRREIRCKWISPMPSSTHFTARYVGVYIIPPQHRIFGSMSEHVGSNLKVDQ